MYTKNARSLKKFWIQLVILMTTKDKLFFMCSLYNFLIMSYSEKKTKQAPACHQNISFLVDVTTNAHEYPDIRVKKREPRIEP